MKQESIHLQLNRLLVANREGSFGTQAARRAILMNAMADLHSLGYSNLRLVNLKTRHIKALVEDWRIQGLANATLKNRLSHLRWLAAKLNKQNIVPRTNQELGIDKRCYTDNRQNRAKELTEQDLAKVSSERIRLSLQLQRSFGLRREESLKFQPGYADKGDHILLKDSWCKGKRAREVPIRTAAQRALLDACHRLAGKGSMIPAEKTYVQHLASFVDYCRRAGIENVHGYRHQYAQERYGELTGWACPKQGGPTRKTMSEQQRVRDREARLQVSRELGHNRENITNVYLGS